MTAPIDYDQLARLTAALILDSLNAASFADQLGDRVAAKTVEQLDIEFATDSMQGWWRDYVRPPWSGWCQNGEHSRCDGSAPPAESGCACTFCNHRGEPGSAA